MYNRELDFIPYEPVNIPAQEIYLVYSPIDDCWLFEFFDNNVINLDSLESGRGQIITLPFNGLFPDTVVAKSIATVFPSARILIYSNFDEWCREYMRGGYSG